MSPESGVEKNGQYLFNRTLAFETRVHILLMVKDVHEIIDAVIEHIKEGRVCRVARADRGVDHPHHYECLYHAMTVPPPGTCSSRSSATRLEGWEIRSCKNSTCSSGASGLRKM